MECCGQEITTPFCPICGARNITLSHPVIRNLQNAHKGIILITNDYSDQQKSAIDRLFRDLMNTCRVIVQEDRE